MTTMLDRQAPVTHAPLPIFASLGPVPVWSPPTPRFTLYGHKKRKRLARDCTRVLANEGFACGAS
jgi:hypothetical protein